MTILYGLNHDFLYLDSSGPFGKHFGDSERAC